MENILLITQLALALFLVLLILIQERGSGLGEAISGIAAGAIQTKKRGAEKVLAQVTIVAIVLFLALSFALNFLQ